MHTDIETRRKNGRERQQRYLLAHPERGKNAVKRYAERHPDRIRAKDAKESPEKLAARRIVNKAIRAGKLVRGNCWCGLIGQAHHEDYAKPLDVIWLCAVHHKQEHMRRATNG